MKTQSYLPAKLITQLTEGSCAVQCSGVTERVVVTVPALGMAGRWFVQPDYISCMPFGGF